MALTYKWRLYKARNNPPCSMEDDCFYKIKCQPPHGYYCYHEDEALKGLCLCLEYGLRPEDWYKNTPTDAGPPPAEHAR
jgi:hypothetical protein